MLRLRGGVLEQQLLLAPLQVGEMSALQRLRPWTKELPAGARRLPHLRLSL